MSDFNTLPNEASPQLTDRVFTGRGAAAGAERKPTLTSVLALFQGSLDSVYQPLDSDLTAIAALSTTSYGRSVLELANAAAARTLFGAGTGNGDVVGPASSVNSAIPIYSGTTGKILADSGIIVGSGLTNTAPNILIPSATTGTNNVFQRPISISGVTGISGNITTMGGKPFSFGTGGTRFTAVSGIYAGQSEFDAGLGYGYNMAPGGVANDDIATALTCETRYLNATSGLSTEWYINWQSQLSGSDYLAVRPIQFNINHIDSGDVSRFAGYVDFNIKAELFDISSATSSTLSPSGGSYVRPNFLRFTGSANTFQTTAAGTFNGSLTGSHFIGTSSSTSTLSGSLDVGGFLIRVGNSGRFEQLVNSSGGQLLQLFRGAASGESVRLGAAAGEATFGSVSNTFLLDIIGNPNVREFLFRTSADGGTSYTTRGSLFTSGRWRLGAGGDDSTGQLQVPGRFNVLTAADTGTSIAVAYAAGGAYTTFANLTGNNPGIWFCDSGSAGNSNYALQGNSNTTLFNVPSGGALRFRIGNGDEMVFASGAVTISDPVTVQNGIASQGAFNVGPSATPGTNISRVKHGVATLVGGTVTVSETTVTANSRIFLTSNVDGGTLGAVRVSARTASTSFTITSLSGIDTSTVAWLMIEP